MLELTDTIRAMRFRSLAKRRAVQLRIDRTSGGAQVVTIIEQPGAQLETVDRTFWLPKGLEISEAPEMVTSSPRGGFSASAIVVTAPAYQRVFRVTTDERGQVRLDEEPTS